MITVKSQSAGPTPSAKSSGQKGDYWTKGSSREGEKPKAYYQRNDRHQARGGNNPHAPPKLTPAQRKARGPLPDWDDIQV